MCLDVPILPSVTDKGRSLRDSILKARDKTRAVHTLPMAQMYIPSLERCLHTRIRPSCKGQGRIPMYGIIVIFSYMCVTSRCVAPLGSAEVSPHQRSIFIVQADRATCASGHSMSYRGLCDCLKMSPRFLLETEPPPVLQVDAN